MHTHACDCTHTLLHAHENAHAHTQAGHASTFIDNWMGAVSDDKWTDQNLTQRMKMNLVWLRCPVCIHKRLGMGTLPCNPSCGDVGHVDAWSSAVSYTSLPSQALGYWELIFGHDLWGMTYEDVIWISHACTYVFMRIQTQASHKYGHTHTKWP